MLRSNIHASPFLAQRQIEALIWVATVVGAVSLSAATVTIASQSAYRTPGVGLDIALSRFERNISADYSADAPEALTFQPLDAVIEGESIRENSARSTKQRARTVPKSETISTIETLPIHFSPEVNAPEPFVPTLVIIQAPETIAEPILTEAVPVDLPVTNVAAKPSNETSDSTHESSDPIPETSDPIHEISDSTSSDESGADDLSDASITQSNIDESDEPSPVSSDVSDTDVVPEPSISSVLVGHLARTSP